MQLFILLCWNGRGRAFDQVIEEFLAHIPNCIITSLSTIDFYYIKCLD